MTSNSAAVKLPLLLSELEDSLLFDRDLEKEKVFLFEDGKERGQDQFDARTAKNSRIHMNKVRFFYRQYFFWTLGMMRIA